METKMTVTTARTIQGIVLKANIIGVQKDQIVGLYREGEQYVLVYYVDVEGEY